MRKRGMLSILKYAIPIILSSVMILSMNLVDLFFVSRLGSEAVSGVGLGGSIAAVPFLFGLGVVYGLDYFVSTSWGEKDQKKGESFYFQSLWVTLWISVPLILLTYFSFSFLPKFGIYPETWAQTEPYLFWLNFSLLPVLWFSAGRQYLQATGNPYDQIWILIGANVLNALLNPVLIFGKFGFPAMGVEGAGVATLFVRVLMFLWVTFTIIKKSSTKFEKIEMEKQKRLLKMGTPIGVQFVLEGGIFSLTTFLSATFHPTQSAAHHIVLQIASLTFMMAMGISAATTVFVGKKIGEKNPPEAWRLGTEGVKLSMIMMFFFALVFWIFPRLVLSPFSQDEAVLSLASSLLIYAGFFQVFDGAQANLGGALRGFGDSKLPMIANLMAHWWIGFPILYWFGYMQTQGVLGFWKGLCASLFSVSILLGYFWMKKKPQIYK